MLLPLQALLELSLSESPIPPSDSLTQTTVHDRFAETSLQVLNEITINGIEDKFRVSFPLLTIFCPHIQHVENNFCR